VPEPTGSEEQVLAQPDITDEVESTIAEAAKPSAATTNDGYGGT
jgi:hypothetical protein